jgi:hypothetical protein
MVSLLQCFPLLCIVAGGIVGLCIRRRIESVGPGMMGGLLGGLLLTLVPYLALRLSGALCLSYGNGLYCIEPGPWWGGVVPLWPGSGPRRMSTREWMFGFARGGWSPLREDEGENRESSQER